MRSNEIIGLGTDHPDLPKTTADQLASDFFPAHTDFMGVGQSGNAVTDKGMQQVRFVGQNKPSSLSQTPMGRTDRFAPVERMVQCFKDEDAVETLGLRNGLMDRLHRTDLEAELSGQTPGAQ